MTDEGSAGQRADYVVAGAGSSGCVVARRLADAGASVILLEAGGSDRSMMVRKPGMVAVMHAVPEVKKRFDWGYYSTPQVDALGRKIPQVRGKVLGGSSSINGMIFVRGNRQNFDDWAADGCPGWSYADVLKSYRRLENWEDGPTDHRGSGGPVQVTRVQGLAPASDAFIDALARVSGTKRVADYNGPEQEGVGPFQQSVGGGVRYSSSVSYLDGKQPGNLTIRTGVTVSRVVIHQGRATGVEVITAAGREVINADQEVVLSAGVYGSAQILMLSGIGPASHLKDVGVDVVADLPVGDNLHDHLFAPMTFTTRSALHRGTTPYFARSLAKEYLGGGGWMSHTVFDAVGFVRSSLATTIPDIQIHVLPWAYPTPNQDAPIRHAVHKKPAITLMSTLIYPRSRGTVRLASSDPLAAPLIDPAYLKDPLDAQVLLDGMEIIRAAVGAGDMESDVAELHPGGGYRDRAALGEELPNRATTVYHPVGSCRMGSDERAVVDPQLRVRGISGLRVADSSIMPSITGGNTNAPALMIGEHCAAIMTSERVGA
jgi:choline dehydrogenase-like flavoprotein